MKSKIVSLFLFSVIFVSPIFGQIDDKSFCQKLRELTGKASDLRNKDLVFSLKESYDRLKEAEIIVLDSVCDNYFSNILDEYLKTENHIDTRKLGGIGITLLTNDNDQSDISYLVRPDIYKYIVNHGLEDIINRDLFLTDYSKGVFNTNCFNNLNNPYDYLNPLEGVLNRYNFDTTFEKYSKFDNKIVGDRILLEQLMNKK